MVTMNLQVAWGKVKGYPWWPGVVDLNNTKALSNQGETLTFIQFIGENTHAYLSSKDIQDFEKNYQKHSKTNHKVLVKKHLLNCILTAQELANGNLDILQIQEINYRLIQTRSTQNVKVIKELDPKISELSRLIAFHDSLTLEPAVFDSYKVYEKNLSEIVDSKSIESNIQVLCDILISLAKLQINKQLLKRVSILKLLNDISNACLKSPFEKVKEIGTHALNLKVSMSKQKKSSGLVDYRLKVVACKKIASNLELNGFSTEKARLIALSIEEKIRKLDPSMGVKYRNCFKLMIRDIRGIRYEDYAIQNS